MCCVVLGSLVWEMWWATRLVDRFSGVELRFCFSLGSGFVEFSSLVNRSGQAEPKLKQSRSWTGGLAGIWLQVF